MLPAQQKLLNDYSELIKSRTDGNPDAKIKYASILQGADNYKKKNLGEMAGADRIGLTPARRPPRPSTAPGSPPIPKRARDYDRLASMPLVTQANRLRSTAPVWAPCPAPNCSAPPATCIAGRRSGRSPMRSANPVTRTATGCRPSSA
jgi:hypothetical protein